MKTLNIALVTLALAACSVSSSFAQLITNFSDAENGGGWTLTGATITGTEGLGDLIYNAADITLNATGTVGISITASVTTAPANGFKFSLFDATGVNEATASFDWASFTSGPATVVALFDFVSPGFNYGTVTTWNLIGGSSGSAINASLTSASLVPVPEPSTYAALSGIAVLGFVAYRRRRSAA